MASVIKNGESLFIPFRDGLSISDSQLKPRMYKTMKAFEKAFPRHYLGTNGVELVEYSPVVRCKDCESYDPIKKRCDHPHLDFDVECYDHWINVKPEDFCSYGERRTDEN